MNTDKQNIVKMFQKQKNLSNTISFNVTIYIKLTDMSLTKITDENEVIEKIHMSALVPF